MLNESLACRGCARSLGGTARKPAIDVADTAVMLSCMCFSWAPSLAPAIPWEPPGMAAYTLCTGNVSGALSIGKGRALVSIQGDGVSCYDCSTQVRVWAMVQGPRPAMPPPAACDWRLWTLQRHPLARSARHAVMHMGRVRAHANHSQPVLTSLLPACPSPLQKPVLSWALGGADQEFAGPAVYDYASNLCFAAVVPRGGGGGGKAATSTSLLAWGADEHGGTITQLSHALHLPPLHSLLPLTAAPQGEAEEAAAAEAEERAGMEVDGSGQARGGALAVLASGGVALCSGTQVVAEAEEARGQHTVAAAYAGGRLVQVVAEPRGGGVSAAVYRVQDRAGLECEGMLQLEPPAPGCRAVTATSTAERTAVLWSDGSVAVYAVPGDRQPLLPLPTGPSRAPLVQRRLAGFRLPAGKQQQQQKTSGSSKKRGAAEQPDAAPGGVSMAAIGDKQVAVVGWAAGSQGAGSGGQCSLVCSCCSCCCRCRCWSPCAGSACQHNQPPACCTDAHIATGTWWLGADDSVSTSR